MVLVNVDNFRAAETALVFDNTLAIIGDINRFDHFREPTQVDKQPAIRMNRDTLYSAAIVDISRGATVTLPEAEGRYMTMMIINSEHYINRVFTGPGSYELAVEEHGSTHVNATVRTFVDPDDPEDIAKANRLQDAIAVQAASSMPYTHPDYDQSSLNATREALQRLGDGVPDTDRMFGKKSDVEPTRHLLGTAIGFGGLPESEAHYYIETEPRPAGDYTFTFKDVPVDAFWSVTIYNRDGYYEANPYNSYGRNGITAKAASDGTVTLNLAANGEGQDNFVYVMDGWNYVLRLYKPRPEVLDRTWIPPKPQPVS